MVFLSFSSRNKFIRGGLSGGGIGGVLLYCLLLLASTKCLCNAFLLQPKSSFIVSPVLHYRSISRTSVYRPVKRRGQFEIMAKTNGDSSSDIIDAGEELAVEPKRVKDMSEDEMLEFLGEKSEARKLYYLAVIIIGAGAAGIGMAHALLRGGMHPSKMLLLDRGPTVGSSFEEWHNTTQFISPSWPSYPFGSQDLNAVVPDTSVNGKNGQHPSGKDYASYLVRMVKGTNLNIYCNHHVTSIERLQKGGCFVIQTTNEPKGPGNVFIANYVVWAGGEWTTPRYLNTNHFPNDATVHYKDASIDSLLQSRRSDDDRIILVGGGEAGADLGIALADKGANVLIIESDPNDSSDDENMDPSRQLSPSTQDRLAKAGRKIDFRYGTTCVSVKREGGTVRVRLVDSKLEGGRAEEITTGSNVVQCTGFDSSSNPLLKDLFHWRKDGSPEVTPASDESTISRNLFLSGPSLMHTLTCGPDEDEENREDDEDDTKKIIFCFVYKYRTRFPVVASEIISRYVEDQKLIGNMEEKELDKILENNQNMQDFYRSKGMMLTDLSCASLACGLSSNDTPTYDHEPSSCSCKPGVCETC